MRTITAYQSQSKGSKYHTALQCIVDRCGLDSSFMLQAASSNGETSTRIALIFVMMAALVAAIAVGVAHKFHSKRRRENHSGAGSHLMKDEKENYVSTVGVSNKLT